MHEEKKILFVDDDLQFLKRIKKSFLSLNKKESRRISLLIETSPSAGDAMIILQDKDMDLTVTDIRMPVIDGMKFLRLLHRKHPNIHKVVVTGYADEETRTDCIRSGAELFLEKPRTSEQMSALYHAVIDLLEVDSSSGFTGMLPSVQLSEIVQMLCLGTTSCILDVKSRFGHGKIYLKDGEILHAEIKYLKGEEAFYTLMGLEGGQFDMRPLADPEKNTIKKSHDHLLMEVARLRDEGVLQEKLDKLGSQTSKSKNGKEEEKKAPSSLYREYKAKQKEEREGSSVKADLTKAPKNKDKKAESKGEVKEEIEEAGEYWIETQIPEEVTEFIACSNKGEILAEVESQDAELRVDLLEYFSLKAKQISDRLGCGMLQKVEIIGEEFNAVTEMQSDISAFALSKNKKISCQDLSKTIFEILREKEDISLNK